MSSNLTSLSRSPVALALVITFSHMLPSPTQATQLTGGDWAGDSLPTPTFPIVDETRILSDSYTTAYINVTYYDNIGEYFSDRTETGKFGEGYVGQSSGRVVHVTNIKDPDDHTGCEWPLLGPKGANLPQDPWIALVKRGSCNFEVKVENAYRSNASAVIIYNDKDAATLDKMKLATESERNISAIFTYKWKGEELARLSENESKLIVYITVASHCTRPTNVYNRTSVLFVSVSFIVLMIISLAWLIFYYVQRFRYIHAKDRLSRRLCSAAKRALSKIPTATLTSDDKELQGDGECCAVCIELFKISDILRVLPCKHEFHKCCIDPWLLEHRTCPMCKMDILKHYGFVFTGSQESILQLDIDADDFRSEHRSPHVRAIDPLPQIRESSRQVRFKRDSKKKLQLTEDVSEDSDSALSSRPTSPNDLMLPLPQDNGLHYENDRVLIHHQEESSEECDCHNSFPTVLVVCHQRPATPMNEIYGHNEENVSVTK